MHRLTIIRLSIIRFLVVNYIYVKCAAISTAQRRRGLGGKIKRVGRRRGMGRGRSGMASGPAGLPSPGIPSPMDEERENEEAILEGMYVHAYTIAVYT